MKTILAAAFIAAFCTAPATAQQDGTMDQDHHGGAQAEIPNLKELSPDRLVQAVRYCDGVYHVTNGADEVRQFPEISLRIKTDSSENGPVPGTVALLPAGMVGDRGNLVFSGPAEISGTIEASCAAD